MQTIAETCVRFDAAHLSINLVSEIAVMACRLCQNSGFMASLWNHVIYTTFD